MTACFEAHSNRLSTLSLCLESLRNRTPSNLKLHHISKNPPQNFFWQEDEAPLANEALCLSTPKHNGKSGTGDLLYRCVFYGRLDCLYISSSFYQLVYLKGSEFQMLKNAKCSSSVQNFRCKKFRQVFFSWRARPMRVCNIRCP